MKYYMKPLGLVSKMAEADSTSSESGNDNSENKDMPPPFLPSRPAQKSKLPNRETKDKPKSKEKCELSASSQDKKEVPELPYKVPSWSGIPDDLYSLEVLKNGCIISTIDITGKPLHVVGRLPNCDVCLEHPSVSRYHAVIQYKASETSKSEKGFYLYDLDSTHGTFVNKSPLDARRYYRLRVGYVLKFGGSSRLFILQGPEEPDDSESPQPTEEAVSSSSEVGRVMSEEEYEEWKREREGGRHEDEDKGIDWGMGEDAEEEPAYPADFGQMHDDAEEHQFKDPKKTLRGFFEREGLELEYDVEEKGPGHARVYLCKVKLPIDGPSGEPLYAEAAIAGKKREAVLECAREACRMLDTAGLLRQSTHESKKHKEKNWEENDYYDSDEDTFLDRTGSVEKKRLLRMKRSGKDERSAETFESLTSKLDALDDEIKRNESKLQENSKYHKDIDTDAADSLDDYMSSLGTTLDKAAISQTRRKLFELKKERQRLNKLIQIAKPASLPSLSKSDKAEVLNSNDGVLRNTRSQGASSDIAISSTVDPETILRHEQITSPENKSLTFSVEDPTSSQEADHHSTNHVEQTSAEVTDPNDMRHKKRKHSRPKPDTSSKTQDNQEAGMSEEFISGKVPTDNSLQEMADESDSLTADNQQSQDDKLVHKDSEIPKKRKKRSYGVPTQWEAVNDPSYSAWMPPAGQTGDGRTHLNDKFGY